MKHSELTHILREYGIKEQHALVYLSLLSIGTSSIQSISKKCAVPRSSCEAILESLKKKGFVSEFKRKSVRQYTAEDPKKIINVAEFKINLFKEALPKFTELFKRREASPSVRFYEGQTGVNTVFTEILNEASSIYYFGSADDLFGSIPKNTLDNFIKNRLKKKIPIKIILSDSDVGRSRLKLLKNLLAQGKSFPSSYMCNGVIFIWNNKIVLFSLRENLVTFIIENVELASLLKTAFDLIWDSLPEIKHT